MKKEDLVKSNQAVVGKQHIKKEATNIAADGLSSKNEDYLYHLQKSLMNEGKSQEESQKLIDSLVVEIKENQAKGITANKLYGAPSLKANYMVHGAPKGARTGSSRAKPGTQLKFDKMTILGNVLVFFALFSGMYGIMGLINPKGLPGIITLILVGAAAGVFVAYLNHWMTADRKKGPGFGKVTLIIIGTAILLMGIVSLSFMIPRQFNPVLNPIIYIILGIVAYGIYYFLKRKYNIVINPPRRQ